MARTDWDGPHAKLTGLTEEAEAQGKELTGQDNPTLHAVLKAAWVKLGQDLSVSAFSKSDLAQFLLPDVSPRAIDTRISKQIKPEVEAEGTQSADDDLTINLFEVHGCELNRTHVAIQKGRAYRKPVLVRMGTRRMPPFGRVEVGDTIFLKVSGGPVVRKSTVKSLYSFEDAAERTDEILRLVQGTALETDEGFLQYIREPTSSGIPKNFATVMILEPWEELEHTVTVHPPVGVGSSWVTIRTDAHIQSYLVGERQLPKREKQRRRILDEHGHKEEGDE